MRTATLVFNPVAGRGCEHLEVLKARLSEHFDLRVEVTSKERDADAIAHELLAAPPEVVIAAGGDGTVSLVAQALIGSGVPLGILPYGTSNSIADALRIPTDEEGALQMLAVGVPRTIDTARANGVAMVLHASLGFHATTVARTPRDAKNSWGLFAYLKEGLVNLADLTAFDVEIETDTAHVRCRAVNVTVANMAPVKTVLAQGPAKVAPDDGALDVTIVAASSLAEVVATGLHLLRSAQLGEPATRPNVGYLSARRVRVMTDPKQLLLIDGEDAGEGSLTIECVPQSLVVLAPEPQPETSPSPEAPDARLHGLPALHVTPKAD